MEGTMGEAVAASKEQILVDVDNKEEDVILVSLAQNGFTFRGALLKVKSWPCPFIPRISPSPSASALPSDSVPEQKDDPPAIITTDMTPESPAAESTTDSSVMPSLDLEKKPLQDNADLAAIQHRWSYFQKNVQALPRKNFPSKREKDRLDQVPKLRPRNFLCTKCKFALPGFSRAASQIVSNPNGGISAVDSDGGNSTADNVACTSPSHTRKGKIPLKRASVNRPIAYGLSPSDWTSNAVTEAPKSDQSMESPGKQISKPPNQGSARKEKASLLGKRKRMLASEGLPRISMPVSEEISGRTKEPPTVATILSPPSGDNGLKMKIKLSASTSPSAVLEDKVKAKRTREKKVKPVVEPVMDEDDDDDRPRLRIDDSFPSDSNEESVAMQPSEPASGDLPASPVKKKRMKAPTAGSSTQATDGLFDKKVPQTLPDHSSNTLPTPVARAVSECLTKDGRTFRVGDIVWGKLTGYPWWPGRINHIVVCDDPMLERSASALTLSDPKSLPVLQYQEAQIEWYGQKASISYIEVNQLSHFVEDFDKRHKPKLRGSYLEAIKLANEAVRSDSRTAGGPDDEPEERDIFSELAALEMNHAKNKFASTSSSLPKASPASDIYDFTTNDIFGRAAGAQKPRNSDFHMNTFNSLS